MVLATLLLHANEPVSTERLYEVIWGSTPPVSARATLQTYVLRLRQLIARHGPASCPIRTVPHGYTIDADSESLDLLRFRTLVASAHRAAANGDLAEEARALTSALSLWHGAALTNVQSEVLQREEVPRLTEEWLETTERRIDVDLILGRHRGLISELRPLTAAYPQRERFWEQLVEALYRCGRQAEALDEYRKIKRVLREELGIDPGPCLQQLELAVLRGEPPPNRHPAQAAGSHSAVLDGPRATCQLPLDVPDFVGRREIGKRIAADLAQDAERRAPAIAAIRGAPGVGKSALALRVAHQLRTTFPDGQWYVRLSDANGNARQPADVLIELMQVAGVESRRIPAAAVARPAMLRASMTDRHVLLVLDDVVSVEQVLPLLPGTSGCGVLITSRANLVGLTALFGVRSHLLEPLSVEDSTELLARMIGREIVNAELDAAVQLAQLCDHLPLALRIAAAKLVDRPGHGVAEIVRCLGTDPLGKLSVGRDCTISVRRAYDTSYARLGPNAREVLRLIGELGEAPHTVDEIAVHGNMPAGDAEGAVDELIDASLLGTGPPDRVLVSPLLCRYARTVADDRVKADALAASGQ